MSRTHFVLGDAPLVVTLDDAPGACGLLIVSGGNELRAGPWGGHAAMAARIAKAGFPVLRFDRQGVGDSGGANTGFLNSGNDIAAAMAAFRARCPHVTRVVGFGNCDAASALILNQGAGCDALILANPWTFDSDTGIEAAPPAVLRRHYLRRLTNLSAWARLLRGQSSVGPMLRGVLGASRRGSQTELARRMHHALARFAGPVIFLVGDEDRTGQAFLANWDRYDPRVLRCPGATHSFIEPASRMWLEAQILASLRGQ